MPAGDLNVLIGILLWVYGLGAALFMTMTFLEGWADHDGWSLRRIAGFASCLFWPLLVVVFTLHARRAAAQQTL
jgi:hypothetical protein